MLIAFYKIIDLFNATLMAVYNNVVSSYEVNLSRALFSAEMGNLF